MATSKKKTAKKSTEKADIMAFIDKNFMSLCAVWSGQASYGDEETDDELSQLVELFLAGQYKRLVKFSGMEMTVSDVLKIKEETAGSCLTDKAKKELISACDKALS